ncbi:MAG TPA: hypothetical protein DCM05_11950 [Elusimicrobia bacterium]|nr:hypothetical protein [Elusimicrobiota bacterium]
MQLAAVAVIAFISEYLDSGLGMGYGTALAPILILMGYSPLSVVPAILVSQLITDIAACVTHHQLNNVDFRPGTADRKVATALGLICAVGVIISVVVAVRIPKWVLTLYIGVLVAAMGVLILATANKQIPFSWKKVLGLGLLASFNKGISGGGYGPVVMGGQMLSGIGVKNAVGITALAEAITCLVGFLCYLFAGKYIDWKLTGILILAATPAVPFAAATVKNLDPVRMKRYVGVMIVLLGLLTLTKLGGG